MDGLTRILARVGTVCVVLPFIAPVLFGLVRLLQSGHLLVDYLMPFELYFLILFGAGLLVWASLRAHRRRALVAGSIGVSMTLLAAGSAFATLTGLASGEHAAEGWPLVLVASCMTGSLLAVLVLAGAGVLLLRDLSGPDDGRTHGDTGARRRPPVRPARTGTGRSQTGDRPTTGSASARRPQALR